jgi:hypothetical protein
MIRNKRAQVMTEYTMVYFWAIFIMIVFIGGLSYFGFFNLENNKANFCQFDANFYCSQYQIKFYAGDASAVGTHPNTFNMTFFLQNNMDANIVINKTQLFDENDAEIVCQTFNLTCPLESNIYYIQANPSNTPGAINSLKTSPWSPTRVCKVEYIYCNKILLKGSKELIDIQLNFSSEISNITHISNGQIYTKIQ